jgi:AP-3 complex subunit delta-1
MIGYDMSWASFRIIEVMSAQWFGHRRVGYLAATLSFTQSTDVVLLTTHLFRKVRFALSSVFNISVRLF